MHFDKVDLSGGAGPTHFPLTTGQRDIWIAQVLDPTNDSMLVGVGIECFGQIDAGLLESALRQTVSENDSQHLNFLNTEIGPRQYFRAVADFDFPIIDFTNEKDPRSAAMAWMQADRAKPFDIENGPLFRYALIKIAVDRFFLYCIYHHLIIDWFGSMRLFRRIGEIYSALVQRRDPPPSTSLSFLELVDEDATYHCSRQYARDRDYWRKQLANRPGTVTLSGHPPHWRGAVRNSEAIVPRRTVERLQRLGAVQGVGLTAVVMASVSIYHARMTGIPDVILGMPMAGRTNQKMHRVVGLATNLVPLRLKVAPEESIGSLLDHVGRRFRDALRHQRYWSSELREDLGLTPDQPALYGMVVNFKPADEDFDFAGIAIRKHVLTMGGVEDFMIAMQFSDRSADLRLSFNANERHYDEEALEVHRRRFLRLIDELAAASDRPDQPIGRLDLFSVEKPPHPHARPFS